MAKKVFLYTTSFAALVLSSGVLLGQSTEPRDAWLMRNYRFTGPPPPGSIGATDPVVSELRQIQNTLLSIMRKANFGGDYEAALAAAAQAAMNAQLIGTITERLAEETPTKTIANERESTSPSAPAYSIALKDHSVDFATAYWVDGFMLHYMSCGGAHVIVRLDLVDRGRSIELNRLKNLKFSLPESPATLTFTLDPGRSPVIRTPGTNLYTGAGSTNQGTVISLQLSSPNAINAVPIIRVFMNYRDSTMRGVIYPVATVPNSTTAGYEGLQDVLLDPGRHRVYVTNSGYNRIEVFDTQRMAFQQPIPVGQLPHQMALGPDGATLYVATSGGEQITLVNLDQQQVIGRIQNSADSTKQ
jgi:hypothetical protein